MVTTERQKRLAQEREEIAARVATFKATQEKFQREREEFFRRTWRNIGEDEKSKLFWS
jgi:chorismate mutase